MKIEILDLDRSTFQAAFDAAKKKADSVRGLANKIHIIDIDRTFPADGFMVTFDAGAGEEQVAVKYDDFGDWLVAAGHFDGFTGCDLIQYGAPDFRRDNRTGELIEKKGRDRSQPISEFVQHDLDDETLAAYVAELITSKTAAV